MRFLDFQRWEESLVRPEECGMRIRSKSNQTFRPPINRIHAPMADLPHHQNDKNSQSMGDTNQDNISILFSTRETQMCDLTSSPLPWPPPPSITLWDSSRALLCILIGMGADRLRRDLTCIIWITMLGYAIYTHTAKRALGKPKSHYLTFVTEN